MRQLRAGLCFSAVMLSTSLAHAAGTMDVSIPGLAANSLIPPEYAYCALNENGSTIDGGNYSPEIRWGKGPAGTASYAIIMHDPEVPTSFADANRKGRTISADLPRRDFYHWVFYDISADLTRLPRGADSDRVEANGKRVRSTRYGQRGLNDYGDTMSRLFAGYDGPCPPWNDEKMHRYIFTVYALDVPTLAVDGAPSAENVLAAMEGHILAKGTAEGKYTLNLEVLERAKTTPLTLPPIPEAAPSIEESAPEEPHAATERKDEVVMAEEVWSIDVPEGYEPMWEEEEPAQPEEGTASAELEPLIQYIEPTESYQESAAPVKSVSAK